MTQPVSEELRVVFDDGKVAETSKGLRLFEMGCPPVYYFPAGDVNSLLPIYGNKVCEYLGLIRSREIDEFGIRLDHAAWSALNPAEAYRKIKGYSAFYPSCIDACWAGPPAPARRTRFSTAVEPRFILQADLRVKREQEAGRPSRR